MNFDPTGTPKFIALLVALLFVFAGCGSEPAEEDNDPLNNQQRNNDQVNNDQANNDQVNNEQANNEQANNEQANDDQVNNDQSNNDQSNNDQSASVTVNIIAGPDDITNETGAEFEFACDQDSGCTYECSLNEATAQPCTSPQSYDDLGDGSNHFSVVASYGGVQSDPDTWTWTVDTEPPQVTDLVGPDDPSDQASASFGFDCSKAQCEFVCELSRATGEIVDSAESCVSGVEYVGLQNDDYSFSVYAIDSLGNEGPPSEWTWTVDAEEMEVGFYQSSIIPHDTVVTRRRVEYWCTDPDCTFECALDFDGGGSDGAEIGEWEPCSWFYQLEDLQPGDYEFRIRGTGSSSQVAEAGMSWTNHFVDWDTVTTGRSHTCAISADGRLWCWGSDFNDQLGVGGLNFADLVRTPILVGDSTDWSEIFAGYSQTCGLRDDNTLWCWGHNLQGQLGIGGFEQQSTHQRVGEASDWEYVAAYSHTCGLRNGGELWCWGLNNHGQLGVGDTENHDTPQQVGDSSDWSTVEVSQEHTCGVRDDATLWCWGRDYLGKLGTFEISDPWTPRQVGQPPQ